MTIRLARLDDAAAICGIHRSYVRRWYRVIGAEQYNVGYDQLSIEERWGFGGPWMSVETCAIHLNNMLLKRHLPYVACIDGRVAGMMELYIGREGGYGKNCHIGLLYVHEGDTGAGVGVSMIRHAREVAMEYGCDSLTVSPMPYNEAFYMKCGFILGDTMVEASVPIHRYPVDAIPMDPPLNIQSLAWGMNMAVGRLQSSAYHLFELVDDYALPSSAGIEKHTVFRYISGCQSMISWASDSTGKTACVLAWSDGADAKDLVAAALVLLGRSGIAVANLLLSRDDYDLISREIDATLVGVRATLIDPLQREID